MGGRALLALIAASLDPGHGVRERDEDGPGGRDLLGLRRPAGHPLPDLLRGAGTRTAARAPSRPSSFAALNRWPKRGTVLRSGLTTSRWPWSRAEPGTRRLPARGFWSRSTRPETARAGSSSTSLPETERYWVKVPAIAVQDDDPRPGERPTSTGEFLLEVLGTLGLGLLVIATAPISIPIIIALATRKPEAGRVL